MRQWSRGIVKWPPSGLHKLRCPFFFAFLALTSASDVKGCPITRESRSGGDRDERRSRRFREKNWLPRCRHTLSADWPLAGSTLATSNCFFVFCLGDIFPGAQGLTISVGPHPAGEAGGRRAAWAACSHLGARADGVLLEALSLSVETRSSLAGRVGANPGRRRGFPVLRRPE